MIRRNVAGLFAAAALAFGPPSSVLQIRQKPGAQVRGTGLSRAFGPEPALIAGNTELSAGTNITTVVLEFSASDAHASEIADTTSLQISHALAGANGLDSKGKGLGFLDESVFAEGTQETSSDFGWPPAESRLLNNGIAMSPGRQTVSKGQGTLASKSVTGGSIVEGKAVVRLSRSQSSLTISWWPTGGMLQSTPLLRGSSTLWTNVGRANPAVVQVGNCASFYRVVQ